MVLFWLSYPNQSKPKTKVGLFFLSSNLQPQVIAEWDKAFHLEYP